MNMARSIINASEQPVSRANRMFKTEQIAERCDDTAFCPVASANAERILKNSFVINMAQIGGITVYTIKTIPAIPVTFFMYPTLAITLFMLSLTTPPAIGISFAAPYFNPFIARLSAEPCKEKSGLGYVQSLGAFCGMDRIKGQ